ncbi:MAG: ester cyclase [Pseudomonadota bacterium]
MSFLPGFDPRWSSVEDYILGITEDIWERRQIDSLTRYYADGLIVRSPASVVVGNDGIIAATMATLAEFPDRQLPGEDVIWCATGADSFLSSHRLYCTATHTGAGVYGAPTGRKLAYRILADCWCRENAVQDEWLVRDQAAIVTQMGMDVRDWTRDLIAREGGPDACVKPLSPATDLAGPYTGRGNDTETGARAADLIARIMGGDLSVVASQYDRACALHYPAHTSDVGRAGADAFWLNLRSAFPSAQFSLDHVIGRDDAGHPPRAALRWSLHGRHDGWGRYGRPSGADVYVLGITHLEFGPRGVSREWTLIDDTAIWKQILLATGTV